MIIIQGEAIEEESVIISKEIFGEDNEDEASHEISKSVHQELVCNDLPKIKAEISKG